MMRRIHRTAGGVGSAGGAGATGVPGKTTLIEQLVQRGGAGAPVAAPIRERAEQATGADLSGVRVHTDGASAEAAASVGARAYAVGQDVHFGAGNYQPGTAAGDRLIAHELVHTIQQRDAATGPQCQLEVSAPGDAAEVEADRVADAVMSGGTAAVSERGAAIARDTDPGATGWDAKDLNPAYKTPRTANFQIEDKDRVGAVDKYRDKVQGDPKMTASASEVAGGKGTKVNDIHLAPEDIYYIVGQHLDDVGKGREKQVQTYLDQMVEAFRIMKIDTVEAMALYLAHAAGETMFAYLTEGQVKDKTSGDHQTPDDKRQAFLDEPDKLNEAQDAAGPRRYANTKDKAHGTVDPANKIDPAKNPTYKDTFIGRGPVQVTHDYEYVKCLVILEEMAKTASEADRATIDEAVKEIKLDPRQAANPKYTFLFSAAFMHESGGVAAAAQVNQGNATFSGRANDPSANWVAGGGFDIYANYDEASAGLAAAKKSGDPKAIEAAQKKFNEWAGHRSRAVIKSQAYGRGLERQKAILARQEKEGGYHDSAGAWQPTVI
jgi:Domain of unknown function (DUF4157)